MTLDRRLYFPSDGRRAEDFYLPLKIRRLRPGSNPRTWVPKAGSYYKKNNKKEEKIFELQVHCQTKIKLKKLSFFSDEP